MAVVGPHGEVAMMGDGIEWPEWVERLEVYRDGPRGQFYCAAWVDDDAYWTLDAGEFIGVADTIVDAIRKAIDEGNAKAREVSQ